MRTSSSSNPRSSRVFDLDRGERLTSLTSGLDTLHDTTKEGTHVYGREVWRDHVSQGNFCPLRHSESPFSWSFPEALPRLDIGSWLLPINVLKLRNDSSLVHKIRSPVTSRSRTTLSWRKVGYVRNGPRVSSMFPGPREIQKKLFFPFGIWDSWVLSSK